MMKPRVSLAFLLLSLVGIGLGACGGGANVAAPAATCGPPPPVPVPFLVLSYPEPNATSVPDAFGTLLFVGFPFDDYFGPTNVTLTTLAGANVPVGAFTAPPSPLPSPYVVPSGFSSTGVSNIPFVAAPVPMLSPSTIYNVTFTYADFGDTPPTCRTTQSESLGSFTTH